MTVDPSAEDALTWLEWALLASVVGSVCIILASFLLLNWSDLVRLM